MLKRLILISSVSLVCSAMLGCTLTQPRLNNDTNCERLKRQNLYNATNPNIEAGWLTSTQRAKLNQQISQNNCEESI